MKKQYYIFGSVGSLDDKVYQQLLVSQLTYKVNIGHKNLLWGFTVRFIFYVIDPRGMLIMAKLRTFKTFNNVTSYFRLMASLSLIIYRLVL